MKFSLIYYWVLSIICIFASVQAQNAARALGLANSYTSLARGVHAADWNPANLALPDNPNYSITFFGIYAHTSNNSLTQAMYNKYNGRYLDKQAIDKILSSIDNKGLNLTAGANLRTMSISFNNMALTVGLNARVGINIDKDAFEMALRGNHLDQPYNLNDMAGEFLGIGLLKFSYAHPFSVDFAQSFAVGASLNLLSSQYYSKLTDFNMSFLTHDFGFDVNGSYSTKSARGHNSWDVSVGTAAIFKNGIQLGLTFKHLSSHLKWDTHVSDNNGFVSGDSLILMDFENKKASIQDSTWKTKGIPFKTRLPLQVQIGMTYPLDQFLLAVEYMQCFNRNIMTSPVPQIGFGAERKTLDWLILRTGMLFGGKLGYGLSFGAGLRYRSLAFDFGVMNKGIFFPSTSKGIILSAEMGVNL